MSGSGDLVRAEVYTLLGITNTASPLVPLDTARQAINRQVALVAKELGLGHAWVSPAFTTTLVDKDYAFPATVEYEQVLRLVYNSDQRPLVPVSMDQVAQSRSGATSSHGRQYAYALDKTPAGVLTAFLPGLPSAAEAVNAYVSTMPVPWPAGSTAPPTIPFSTTALQVLYLLAAEDLGRALGESKLTALDLNPKTFDSWHVLALELLKQEQLTVIRIKRSCGPYNYGWFSTWSDR